MRTFKTGRKAKRTDKRTLKFRTYLATLPPLPSSIDWSDNISPWEMLGNDTVGDCTCAAPAHAGMLWTSNALTIVVPTTAQVLANYSAITGYDPSKTDAQGNNPTDTGADMLTVMNYWRSTGIAGRKIAAYAELNTSVLDEVRASVMLFGVANVGVNLPQTAMDETNSNQIWSDVSQTSDLDGHDILIVAFDANGFWCITWGQKQYLTNAWATAYFDESYCPLSADWIAANGNAPSGFNMAQLTTDLAALPQAA